MPDKPQRPGSMSGEDRELEAMKRRRSPALGVPILDAATVAELVELGKVEEDLEAEADAFDDQFTPVAELLALAKTADDRNLVIGLWKHSARQELRHRRIRNRSSEHQMRKEIDELQARAIDTCGKDGTNGKLGELRRRVDALTSKAWWLFTAFVGGIGAASVKLVIVVRAFDAVEATTQQNAARLLEQQARILRLETAAITRRYRPAIEPERTPDHD